MAKQSAGILVYRKKNDGVEVFLVHAGGPFWAKKDDYAWSMPKGEYQDDENPFEVAKREFEEEIGQPAPDGKYDELGEVKLKSSKVVTCWTVEKDLGEVEVKSNTFTLEWPPKSGKIQKFPEVDRGQWYNLSTASRKIHPGLGEFLKRLAKKLNTSYKDQSDYGERKLSDKQISLL